MSLQSVGSQVDERTGPKDELHKDKALIHDVQENSIETDSVSKLIRQPGGNEELLSSSGVLGKFYHFVSLGPLNCKP